MKIPQSTMRNLWERLPLLALVLLVLIAITLAGVIKDKKQRLVEKKKSESAAVATPVNVAILRLAPKPIRDRLNLPATVEAQEDLLIKAEIAGKVETLAAREGARISRGSLIARIEQSDYRIALEGAEAAYAQAKKGLSRAKNLYSKEIIAEEDYDAAIANEKMMKARLDQASLNLERTEITSPINGILNRMDAKNGLLLKHGDPVAQVLDIDPVKVVVGIPESDVNAVRRLDTFDLTVKALGDKHFKGKKGFLSKQPSSQAHLYMLEILVTNHKKEILPGMFARVDIVKKEVPDGLSVPLYSIITKADQQFVYVEADGMAHLRQVSTGILEGWRMQITSGLNTGENVIVVGHRNVADGQAVKVIRSVSDSDELLK